jgi:DNA-binding GntR family transcriptional regulator
MLLVPRLVLPSPGGGPDAPAAAGGSLADAVVVSVRDAIAAGELVEGTTYSVYQLADLLGVSRSPVREALLRLAEAGLVEIARNRGFRVVLPTAHDVEEIFEVRLALEPAACRRLAAAPDPGVRAGVADHLEAMRRAARDDDADAFWPADRALHDALLRAAGNARAAAIVAQLRATTALLGPPTTATGRSLAEILAEHEPIVAAVVAGAPDRAEAAMRGHLETTGARLVEQVRGRSGVEGAAPSR